MSVFLLLAACASSSAGDPPAPAETLAKADAKDGKVDHVVEKCATCTLGMAGDPSHAVKHEGYDLHFCSESCQKAFEKDPPGQLARLGRALKE